MPKKPTALDEVRITYRGTLITSKPRYIEGHVMTANDAALANRAWLNGARAAFAEKAKAMAEGDTTDEEIAKQFAEFIGEWEYSPPTQEEHSNPAMPTALDLARREVVAEMKKQNIFVKDVEPKVLRAAVRKHLERNYDRIMPIAERRLAESEAVII